ncbi:MAG: endonuclease III [Deltaproteobacteria bacterium]|nr:endonuclease III [Deltaproteobacteria bacterium]
MKPGPTYIPTRLNDWFGTPDPPPKRSPLDELILTILSQNTNDRNRDRAFSALVERFPHWKDVLSSSREELEKVISPAGLGPTKSRRIWRILLDIPGPDGENDGESLGDICHLSREEARERLTSLKGVGPKTAACVLLFSCGIPAFPVDTHIFRVCRRLGILKPGVDRVKAHWILEQFFYEKDYLDVHLNMIRLGREICRSRNPLCPGCPLGEVCPSFVDLMEKQGDR